MNRFDDGYLVAYEEDRGVRVVICSAVEDGVPKGVIAEYNGLSAAHIQAAIGNSEGLSLDFAESDGLFVSDRAVRVVVDGTGIARVENVADDDSVVDEERNRMDGRARSSSLSEQLT